MQQHAIARISLITAVAGVISLLLLSYVFEPREASIAEISDSMLESRVIVKARVDSAVQRETVSFFQLNDGTGKIKAVIFNPSKTQRKLISKNSFITVEGKVQLYNGSLEIVVERVSA